MEYTEDQLTEWFNFSEKHPDSPGVYEIKDPDFRLFSYWDGSSWHWGNYQPSACKIDDPMISYHEENLRKFWRGLNFNPSAPKKKTGNKRKTMWLVYERFNFSGQQSLCAIGTTRKEALSIKKQRESIGHTGYSFIIKTLRFRTPEA